MQYYTDLYSTFVQAFANPPSLESNKLGEQSYELPGAKVMGQAKTIKTDSDGYSNNMYKFNVQVPTKTRIPQDIFRILCRYALPAHSW
jgi:hypothetical protein